MKEKIIAIYPGTFDPITNGHIDVINRASSIFDEVIVTLAINQSKKPLFTIEERMEMIDDAIKNYKNVSVSDFEYEFQMALMNKKLSTEITTVFMMPHEKYTYLNSTIIKDVAKFNGNVDNFVTKLVANKLSEKFKR